MIVTLEMNAPMVSTSGSSIEAAFPNMVEAEQLKSSSGKTKDLAKSLEDITKNMFKGIQANMQKAKDRQRSPQCEGDMARDKSRTQLLELFFRTDKSVDKNSVVDISVRGYRELKETGHGVDVARNVDINGKLNQFNYVSRYAVGQNVLYKPYYDKPLYYKATVTAVTFTIEGQVRYDLITKDGSTFSRVGSLCVCGEQKRMYKHVLGLARSMRNELIYEMHKIMPDSDRATRELLFRDVLNDFHDVTSSNNVDIQIVPIEALAILIRMINYRVKAMQEGLI